MVVVVMENDVLEGVVVRGIGGMYERVVAGSVVGVYA